VLLFLLFLLQILACNQHCSYHLLFIPLFLEKAGYKIQEVTKYWYNSIWPSSNSETNSFSTRLQKLWVRRQVTCTGPQQQRKKILHIVKPHCLTFIYQVCKMMGQYCFSNADRAQHTLQYPADTSLNHTELFWISWLTHVPVE